MATGTVNSVFCVQVSSGTFVPLSFFETLKDVVGSVLLPQSVNEVIDKVVQALSDTGLTSAIFGADDLYINVDGQKIWPVDASSVEIDTGDTLPLGVTFEVTGDHWLQLVEEDSGGDDDMGGCWVQLADQGQGQIAKLVDHQGEGSAYYVFYQVD